MATVMDPEREQLDIDTISEYVRESHSRTQRTKNLLDSAILPSASSVSSSATFAQLSTEEVEDGPKPDVLETLWPGVQQDIFHSISVKKTPSFYLMLGFMGGALIALFVAWGFSLFSSFFAHYGKLSSGLTAAKTNDTQASTDLAAKSEVMLPAVPTYEVQEGDTLAAIAIRNYKHISPRLLDEICRANNMTDANVLSLGQKIVLPEYHPQVLTK